MFIGSLLRRFVSILTTIKFTNLNAHVVASSTKQNKIK